MRRAEPLPSWDELVAQARSVGIEHLGVAPADVLERARHGARTTARAAGLDAGMGFTYRNPERSTDPQRAVAGRPVDHRRRPVLPHRRRARRGPPGRRLASPATPGSTTTPRCVPGCGRSPAGCARAGERAVVFADDNAIVDREVAYRAGLGWFGKNANLLVAGAGQLVRARLRRHDGATTRRRRRRWPTGAARAGAASTRCPTGAIVAPGVVDASRCLAWVLQTPGHDPGRAPRGASATASTAATTARRSARRPCTSGAATGRRSPADAEAWVDVLDLLDADDAHAARPPRPLVHRRPRSALAAAQRPRRARQHRPTGDDRASRRRSPATATATTTLLAEHAGWASERLGRRPSAVRRA